MPRLHTSDGGDQRVALVRLRGVSETTGMPNAYVVSEAHVPEHRERIEWQDQDGFWHEEWVS